MKTAEDFVKEHEDSFAYLKEVADPEIYQFYLSVIAAVAREYAAYTIGCEEDKWIDVNDRVPDNGRDVLVGDEESDIVCTAWYSGFEECFNRQVHGMNITHWRELPTPPKQR